MPIPVTTFAATKKLRSVNDVPARVQAILAAMDAGDHNGAKLGQTGLQDFLLRQPVDVLAANETAVLGALMQLPNHRGQRIVSYLRVHTTDPDQRAFWAMAEEILNPRVFSPRRQPAHA